MADELAEINGIKPNVLLEDGEQREVGSATRWVPLFNFNFNSFRSLSLRFVVVLCELYWLT